MPIDYTKYPPDWKAFSVYIRETVAQGRCQCSGECGQTHDGPLNAISLAMCGRLNKALLPSGKPIVLTVAHLCTCNPLCAIEAHVRAMCQHCHLLHDLPLHQHHAALTRARKKSGQGQLDLFAESHPPIHT